MPKKKQAKAPKLKAVPADEVFLGGGLRHRGPGCGALRREPPPRLGAFSQLPDRLIRIEFQVAADGWTAFNDLLLTLEDTAGPYRAAVSIRSKKEITANGFSTDVKAGLMTQFPKAAPKPFWPRNVLEGKISLAPSANCDICCRRPANWLNSPSWPRLWSINSRIRATPLVLAPLTPLY